MPRKGSSCGCGADGRLERRFGKLGGTEPADADRRRQPRHRWRHDRSRRGRGNRDGAAAARRRRTRYGPSAEVPASRCRSSGFGVEPQPLAGGRVGLFGDGFRLCSEPTCVTAPYLARFIEASPSRPVEQERRARDETDRNRSRRSLLDRSACGGRGRSRWLRSVRRPRSLLRRRRQGHDHASRREPISAPWSVERIRHRPSTAPSMCSGVVGPASVTAAGRPTSSSGSARAAPSIRASAARPESFCRMLPVGSYGLSVDAQGRPLVSSHDAGAVTVRRYEDERPGGRQLR